MIMRIRLNVLIVQNINDTKNITPKKGKFYFHPPSSFFAFFEAWIKVQQ